MTRTRIWIDCDPAIGIPGCDVDDGLALIQAFHSPEIEIAGVSAVFGNSALEKTFPLAAEICERFGPVKLPVQEGAAGAHDLGRDTQAVRGMANALDRGPLDILALGPMTNVASLLQLHPDLASRIERIVMVAGRRPGLEFFSTETQETQQEPFPDFNFECDPPAMQAVLDGRAQLVFAPWEVSSHVWVTADDLDALAQTGDPGAYVAAHSRDWLRFWTDSLGAPGFNPFDTLAVAWLTHPELLDHFAGPVRIEPAVASDGAAARPLLVVDAAASAGADARRAIYCHRPHPEFKPLLLTRLGRPAGS